MEVKSTVAAGVETTRKRSGEKRGSKGNSVQRREGLTEERIIISDCEESSPNGKEKSPEVVVVEEPLVNNRTKML